MSRQDRLATEGRLSTRALNRALLTRQLLTLRQDWSEIETIEHLVGMHSQIPVGPYIGLWSRLRRYTPQRLSTMLAERQLVRTALMRSTIHLVTPDDCAALRPLVQPVLDRDLYSNSSHGPAVKGLDLAEVVAAGLKLLDEQPRTPSELGKLLRQRWPDRKPESLAYSVRNLAALVQVPPRGVWGAGGRTKHASAETWLARQIDPVPGPEPVILRYLAAFGPAGVNDVQAWCGLTKLGEVVDRLRPRLRTYRDENGKELFDVPDAPLPDPAIAAPPRYLPEYDNVFLSHADRSRIIPEGLSFAEFSRKHGIFMTARGGILRGNILVNGFLQGIWRIAKEGRKYTLVVEPFIRLSKKDTAALEREGYALLEFAVPAAESSDVRIIPAA